MKKIICIVCFLVTACQIQAEVNYRTKASGNYSNPGIWEWQDTANPGVWNAATQAPVNGLYDISIETPHMVTLDMNLILNDSNATTAPDVWVKGKLIFNNYSIQGESLLTGGSQFVAIDHATLEISNSQGLRNGSAGALKNFAQYIQSPMVKYIFTSNTLQSMHMGTDSVQDLTVNGSGGIIHSSDSLVVSGIVSVQAGTFHVNHSLTLTGNPIIITGAGTMTSGTNASLHFRTTVPGHYIPASMTHLKELELNTVSATSIALQGPLMIDGPYGLTLTSGMLNTGVHTLTLASDLITTGHTNSFVNGTLSVLCETFSDSHLESIVFPVGGNSYQPISLTLSTLTNTGGTYIAVKAFESIPAGTANLIDLGGAMRNRYWQLKVIHEPINQNTNHIAQITAIDLSPFGLLPGLSANSKIGFSNSNQSMSFSGVSSLVSSGHITCGALSPVQIADIGSADGSFIGIANATFASGTYCIGPSASYTPTAGTTYMNANAPYPNITAAFAALNTSGNEGHIIFELQNDYVSAGEANPLAITYKGSPDRTVTCKVRNDLSNPLLIEKGISSGTGVLLFNGASYVTFDGRIGNNPCHASYGLIIRNTLAPVVNQNFGPGTTSISFKQDAHNITIKGLQIDMADNGISFDNSAGTQGCDSINIECNHLRIRTDLLNTNCFTNGIRVSHYNGIASVVASNQILIENNRFDNCGYGININEGATGSYTIRNNSMYRSVDNTPGPGFYAFIWSTNSSLQLKFDVSDNYFGGTAPLCGGAKMNIRGVGNYLNIFQYALSTTTKSAFNNNHIENLTYNLSNVIYAVSIQSGVWDVIGNTIGNPSVPQDIVSTVSNSFYGIHFNSNSNAGTSSMQNRIEQNSINNISFNGASGSEFFGITHGSNVQTFIQYNTIKNISSTATSYFWLIKASVNNTLSNQTNYFNYNTAENIQQVSNAIYEGGGYFLTNAGGNSVWNIVGNRLGSISNMNDIVFNAIAVTPFRMEFSSGIARLDSNIVNHVQFTATTTNVPHAMIDIFATYMSSCAFNNVMQNSDMSKYYEAEGTIGLGASLNGIRISVSSNSNPTSIHHNVVQGLYAVNTTQQTNGIGVVGILYTGTNFAGLRNKIYQNEVYDLRNEALSSGTNPYIHGIHSRTGNIILYNNRIALSNSNLTNTVNISGFYKQTSNIPFSCYHNSISIGGTSTASSKSYAFRKGSSNGTDTIKNNIFQNTRIGNGLNYAMSNYATNSGTWGQCNFNNLFALNPSTIIESANGTSSTFNQWQTVHAKDINSKNLFVTFIDSNLDLHISTASNCGINASGGSGTAVVQDIDGETRSTNAPDIGADEFQGDIVLEAGSEKYICKDSLHLDGQLEPGSTGFWSGTGVTFTPSHTDPNATVHGLSNGLNTLIWHVSNTVCVASDTLKLHVGTSPAPVSTNYTAPVCHDNEIQISLGSPLAIGAWSTGDTTQSIVKYPTTTTTYSVVGTDIYNCPVNYSLEVQIIPLLPLIQASPITPINTDANIMLPLTVTWNPGAGSNISQLLLWPSNQPKPVSGDIVTNLTTKVFNSLVNQQLYYWQIMSSNTCDTVYSDSSSFTTNFPDLTVSNVSIPQEVYANTGTTISWNVNNISPAGNTSNKTWNEGVMLCIDTTIPTMVAYLGTFSNQSYLHGGSSYTQQKPVTIPNGLSGKYYLLVRTDNSNQLIESNESNNIHYDSVIIIPQPVPDIKVISLGSPSNAFAGDSLLITYTVENDGAIPTDSILWQDEIFISSSSIFNASNAISLGSFWSKNYRLDTTAAFGVIKKPVSLQVDSMYTAQSKIKLPTNLLSGYYYIYVKVNRSNWIIENSYSNNNIAKSPIVLDLTQMPPSDLVVDTLITPSVAYSGQPITISWKVKNQGIAVTAISAWTDKVYFDTAASFSNPTLLGTVNRQSPLSVDSSYTASLTSNFPNGISGQYYVRVKTDDPNQVFEYTLENNNSKTSVSTVPILLSPSPDLIVSAASFANDTVDKASPMQLTYTIKNIGTAATSGSFVTNCQYTDSVTYGGTVIVFSTLTHYPSIGVGDSITRTVNYYAPPQVGQYYYTIKVDANNSQYEHNAELNNKSAFIPLTSVQPIPTYSNLLIDSFTTPNNLVTQQFYPLSYCIYNNGPNKTSTSVFYDELLLSSDSILSANDISMKMEPFNGFLDSNQRYTKAISYKLPDETSAGNYYLILRSDRYLNNVNDTNKTDNIHVQPITVTPTPAPDLEVTNIEVADSLYAKQAVWVKYTVRNNGPGILSAKSIVDRVYFNVNAMGASEYNTLGYVNKIRTLNSGDTYTDSFLVTIPTYAISYNYFIVKTDVDNKIFEFFIESNNLATKLTYIQLSSGADLVPTALNFTSTNLSLGDAVDVSYAFTNSGNNSVLANTRNAIHLNRNETGGSSDFLFKLCRQIDTTCAGRYIV